MLRAYTCRHGLNLGFFYHLKMELWPWLSGRHLYRCIRPWYCTEKERWGCRGGGMGRGTSVQLSVPGTLPAPGLRCARHTTCSWPQADTILLSASLGLCALDILCENSTIVMWFVSMFPADCRAAVTGFVLAFLLQMSPMHLSFNSFLCLICKVGDDSS